MLSLALWPILAIWAGLAFVVLALVVGVLGYATLHTLRDMLGVRGAVWCPVLRTTFQVRAIPAAFRRPDLVTDYANLRRCERWGKARIRCGRWCIRAGPLARAATTN